MKLYGISIALVIHSFDPDLAKWVATVVAIGRSLLQELGFAVLNPTYKLRARVFHMIRFRKGGISDENYGYVNYSIGSAFGQQRCARVHALGFARGRQDAHRKRRDEGSGVFAGRRSACHRKFCRGLAV